MGEKSPFPPSNIHRLLCRYGFRPLSVGRKIPRILLSAMAKPPKYFLFQAVCTFVTKGEESCWGKGCAATVNFPPFFPPKNAPLSTEICPKLCSGTFSGPKVGILLSALLSAADASVQKGCPGILTEMYFNRNGRYPSKRQFFGFFFTFSENVRFPNRQLVILDRDLLHRRPKKYSKFK